MNDDEAEFVIHLYYKLVISYPELKSNSQVAIISPYSQQVKLLQEKFTNSFGMDPSGIVDITSVDGCQVIGLSPQILVYMEIFWLIGHRRFCACVYAASRNECIVPNTVTSLEFP